MADADFRPGSDAEWETLLHQWRQRPQAGPSPFFYQRVRARLLTQAAGPGARLPAWLRRPAYAALLAALVLAVSSDGAAPVSGPGPTPHPVRPAPR